MALEQEFRYFLAHQGELVAEHPGKYVAIKGSQVLGFYDTESEAIKQTSRNFPLGTFLVEKCEPGSESYTQTFHSRVTA